MDTWINMIKDVGFPIVVTLYLLRRIEAKLDTLNQTIQRLPQQLMGSQNVANEKKVSI